MTGPVTSQNIVTREVVFKTKTTPKTSDAVLVNIEPDKVTTPTPSLGGEICKIVSNGILNIVGMFSPLINLLNLTQSPKGKVTVEDLSKILNGIKTNMEKDKSVSEALSPESKQAIEKLVKSVLEMSKNNSLKDLDISKLIEKWRQSGSHNALLEMANKIKNKECVQFEDEELRKQFIEGLESLGEALEEAGKQPDSSAKNQVKDELKQAADKIVDNVEIHNERGSDKNYTQEDKEKIKQNFEDASSHIHNVTENPSLAKLIPNSISRLYFWAESITEFLERWYAEKEEEKEREEKLCEERCVQLKKYYEIRHRAEVAKKKERYFKALIKEMMQKIRYVMLTRFEKEKIKTILDYAKYHLTSEASKANYYDTKRCEIVDSLPPSYVCGDGLDLDVTC